MITKEQEAECSKSKLYFKDPGSGMMLTGLEQRVAGPSADSDKFIYPQIVVSTGDTVKLSYALWTDEEKQLYKDYRARSKSNPKLIKEKHNDTTDVINNSNNNNNEFITTHSVDITYDPESAIGEDSKKVIAECDQFCGVWQYAGLTYALLSKKGSNKVYHIPRALIDNENMLRLCNGV